MATTTSSSTSSSTSSTSSSTSLYISPTINNSFAFGEETPTGGEIAKSWKNMKQALNSESIIVGDPDWGLLDTRSPNLINYSPVIKMSSSDYRYFCALQNKYEEGSDDTYVYIRGSATKFHRYDTSIEWQLSTGKVYQDWLYVQIAISSLSSIYNNPNWQSYDISWTSVGKNSISFNWEEGEFNRTLVLAQEGVETINDTPSDGTTYTASDTYGSGDLIGSSYVVYNNQYTSVLVVGLSSFTEYCFRLFNYDPTLLKYNLDTTSNNVIRSRTTMF